MPLRIVALLFALLAAVVSSDRGMAGEAPFTLSAARESDGGLRLDWLIAPGVVLYRDRIAAATPEGKAVPVTMPPGETEDDPNFGPTRVFRDHVSVRVPAGVLGETGHLVVRYQGCAEKGICYPPASRTINLANPAATRADPAPAAASGPAWMPAPSQVSSREPSREPSQAPSLAGSLPMLALTFAGLGLLLAFTPCVWPMVPILAGMLAGSGASRSNLSGFILSATYALAMATAYAALGIAAAWSGRNLQVALQTPAALVAMAALFLILALASFGLFELRMPAAVTARVSGRPAGRLGSVAGAAALGFTAALIVGPCVTPPLAAALLYVAQTGDVGRGALALFALGLGMGLPLVLVGTFGARLLPRSGRWLLAVNQLFGLVFLGIAATLVGRVLPPPAGLALWAVLAVGAGVFAGAFDRLAPTDGPVRRLRQTAGILAVVYGATLVVGAAAGGDDPLRPLAFTHPQTGEAGTIVINGAELDAALAAARGKGRPVLVAFSAEWCTACRTLERTVFTDPAVHERMRAISLIRADVTRPGADSEALMHRFHVAGPPTLIFLDPQAGTEIAGTRTIGEVSATEFRHTLDRLGA